RLCCRRRQRAPRSLGAPPAALGGFASGGALRSVELPPDEPADVVAAGFMVETCLGVSKGDQVRVQEEGHLALEGAPLGRLITGGSVKTIFRVSGQGV
ncbi:MAG: hypothetical protein ACK559_28950, partial [bacterium]